MARRRYEEQAVMAQEYLEAENFEDAIRAYQKAMTMKYGDKELLSIGLAESYAGIHAYDKALEVLRSRYQVSGTKAIKEKIEDITIRKTDYNFYQTISFGDTYFSNGEYDKAIAEYEKAKLIKSREDISYIKIARSYMAKEEYNLAKEEVLEGMALTESESLKKMLEIAETGMNELTYDEILKKASEYIYQENYEEAIIKLNEAIRLIPEKDLAYNQMAELYIIMEEYEIAKSLLQNYLRSNSSDATREILDKVNRLIKQKIEKERVLNDLYTALNVVDIETITNIINDSFFIEKIASDTPYYYSPSGNLNLALGYGMLILDEKNIYAGGFKDNMKEGIGIQLIFNDTEQPSWYYYQGEWDHDIPNGMGRTCEVIHKKDRDGNIQVLTTKTSGMFSYGLESGSMEKTFYINGEESGRVYYTAIDGRPKLFVDESGKAIKADRPDHYVIGEVYLNNEPSGEYYSVLNGTIFSVNLRKK